MRPSLLYYCRTLRVATWGQRGLRLPRREARHKGCSHRPASEQCWRSRLANRRLRVRVLRPLPLQLVRRRGRRVWWPRRFSRLLKTPGGRPLLLHPWWRGKKLRLAWAQPMLPPLRYHRLHHMLFRRDCRSFFVAQLANLLLLWSPRARGDQGGWGMRVMLALQARGVMRLLRRWGL